MAKFIICAVLSVCPAIASGATFYAVTPLPTPTGSVEAYPTHLSSSSLVAGEGTIENGVVPVVWQSGQPTVLPTPVVGLGVYLSGINSSGDAVGAVAVNSPLDSQPAFWQNGQLQLLPASPGLSGVATSINDSGTIVGYLSNPQTNGLQAAMWNNGQLTILGNFPNVQASARAINNSGQVALQVGLWPQIWSNGLFSTIPNPGGTSMDMNDINDNGAAVGLVDYSAGVISFSSAYLYKDGATTVLPSLLNDVLTDAEAINDSGVIVGYGAMNASPAHAIVWQDGQVYDLNDLIPANSGWTLTDATDISDDGTIVGTGIFNGQESAVEVTPIAAPETTTLAVLLASALLLLRRHH